MNCKICDFIPKNNLSLAKHLYLTHNTSLIEYKVDYENFKIPKCACGKDTKHKDGIVFRSTCGNKKCANKIRKNKRLDFMKNNPEQTAWRTKNISYPEKKFIELLKDSELDKKYLIIREKSIFPYFIDFAFENVNVAVEIDGSQHMIPERKNKDNKKDKLLIANGWRVFRVTAKEVQIKGEEVIKKLILFIDDNKTFDKCGIQFSKNRKQKNLDIKLSNEKERESGNGLTNSEVIRAEKQRRVERPPLEQLKHETNELGFSAVGRKYGVSDNAIRKWIKIYETRGF